MTLNSGPPAPEAPKEILTGEKLGNFMFWSFLLSRGDFSLQKEFFEWVLYKNPNLYFTDYTEAESPSLADPIAFKYLYGLLEKGMKYGSHAYFSEGAVKASYDSEYRQILRLQTHRHLNSFDPEKDLWEMFYKYVATDSKFMNFTLNSDGTIVTYKNTSRKESEGFWKLRRSFLYDHAIAKMPFDPKIPSPPKEFIEMFGDLEKYIFQHQSEFMTSLASGTNHSDHRSTIIKMWNDIVNKSRSNVDENAPLAEGQ